MKTFFDDCLVVAPANWRKLPVPGSKNGQRRVVVVDGFAGGGGASAGIEMALARLAEAGLLRVAMILAGVYARGMAAERRRILDIIARKALNAADLRAEINRPLR